MGAQDVREDRMQKSQKCNLDRTDNIMTQEKDKRTNNRLCMLVALIDIFVIKLLSYDLKDHTFMLQTSVSTTPFRLLNITK
jgi:predicted nucleic acid-binding Zn ribbon protein